jgi:hypothetical protein
MQTLFLATLAFIGWALVSAIWPAGLANAAPVAAAPQYAEAIGWTRGSASTPIASPCIRLSFVANDGGIGYPEYKRGVDGGYSFAYDAAIVNDAASVGLIVINNTPTLLTGERYRVIAIGEIGSGVFLRRGSAATTTGGGIYVPIDTPEEMTFSPGDTDATSIYGRCSSGTTCAVDLCPLLTSLGGK